MNTPNEANNTTVANPEKRIGSHQKKIIDSATAKASTVAALPIPVIDVAGVVYIQMDMVRKIAKSYNVEINQEGKVLICSVVSSIVSKLISEAASSLAVSTNIEKVFGESIIKATISGFLTTVVGEVFDAHFRAGGSAEDIGIDAFIDYFRLQVESDKLSVSNISNNVIEKALDKVGI